MSIYSCTMVDEPASAERRRLGNAADRAAVAEAGLRRLATFSRRPSCKNKDIEINPLMVQAKHQSPATIRSRRYRSRPEPIQAWSAVDVRVLWRSTVRET